MKKAIFSVAVLFLFFIGVNSQAFAQRETETGIDVEKDIALLRRDLRAEKKQILAANLTLTETEATKFWPVYDQYAEDMRKLNDEFYALIKDYAAKQKTISDAEAASMIKRWSDIQVQVAQTRQKYVPLFEKAIPGRKTALFFQVDRRLYVLMDIQTASEIPIGLSSRQ